MMVAWAAEAGPTDIIENNDYTKFDDCIVLNVFSGTGIFHYIQCLYNATFRTAAAAAAIYTRNMRK